MLVCVNEDLIRSYKPVLVDSQEAKAIVEEIMERSYTKDESYWKKHEYYSKTIIFKLRPDGYSRKHLWWYKDVLIETFKTPAPYSLQFAAQCLPFLPEDYCSALKGADMNPLRAVLHGEDEELVADILSALENNPELSDNFIKTYHKDLWYLQRLLETVNFECIENPVSDLTPDALERAQDDTETAKRLHLVLPGIPGFER